MKIEHYRKELGLSCEQAASQLGVDESTFNRWERGETVPGGINLMRLVAWSQHKITLADIEKVRAAFLEKKAGVQ